MKVYVPSALRSYTGQKDEVEADGATLGELLRELDRRYPGFRFRIIDEQDSIRPHIKIFVNFDQAHDLDVLLRGDDEVSILLALSGGRSRAEMRSDKVRCGATPRTRVMFIGPRERRSPSVRRAMFIEPATAGVRPPSGGQ